MQDGHARTTLPPKTPNTVTVQGIPSVAIHNNHLVVGDSHTSSTRSYTPIKVLGNGSFGTVWLCDWHGSLPPGTPLSPMQCAASARPQYAGKRLVAVKLMKKRWEGGWDECKRNKELESLRAIPFHPHIIPLYDFFVLPDTKELYFVFESMEGNLYHLIKTRKGRPLAGGLVSSIFHQIVMGLDHIHAHGYFHRDMKPENVLVTTTGIFDYTPVSPVAPPNAPKEKDVIAIIKLADFGLARETNSAPPYTEYVSTRWYRAPEVLLFSRDYSNPVDMWAFGTIMAELVNLRPLFPGQDQADQVKKICEILGDPSDSYGFDSTGIRIGGGPWPKGNTLASSIGFEFPKYLPKEFNTLFAESIPRSLISCIRDLLRYDPDQRLTSRHCLVHPYLQETLPRNDIPFPSGLVSTSQSSIPPIPPTTSHVNGSHSHPSLVSPPRTVPPSHSHSAQNLHNPQQYSNPSITPRIPYPSPAPQPHFSPNLVAHNEYRHSPPPHGPWSDSQADYPMDVVPPHDQSQSSQHVNGHVTELLDSPMIQDHPRVPEPPQDSGNTHTHKPNGKRGPFGKNGRWLNNMFGGDKSHRHNTLPPVDETSPAVTFTSRKRTQSSSTDSRSLRDSSPVREAIQGARDAKKMSSQNKKEAQRLLLEAEIEKRKLLEKSHREMSRAVMAKRHHILQDYVGNDIEWTPGPEQRLDVMESKGKQPASGPVRHEQNNISNATKSNTIGAAAGHFMMPPDPHLSPMDRERRGPSERVAKARRREYDDDHSMSSSDVRSISRMSSISFATVDSDRSDPGPSRLRNRPSLYNLSRVTSRSSLRTSFDDFPPSARSSNSFSLDGQLAHDFRTQASVTSHLSGSISPPPLQLLSLSPTISPSLSPSPPWIKVQQHSNEDMLSRTQSPPYISLNSGYYPNHNIPHSPLDLNGHPPLPPSPYGHPPSSYGYPPSTGHTPKSAKSVINPMFKVAPLPPPPLPPPPTGDRISSPNVLPPFCELEAAAGGELPPLSPMIFTTPEDA
ncbi:Pkinase-domain-containing protein [Pholiota conissans]|uniref:Pkinase-domain-containing protein n=1 Tax=Pholiota conissans TaxID=109636 RepID=A0A9P5YZV2_9AGAR|nr:Pkinase-domain-containing protein [Pholiota conissans]